MKRVLALAVACLLMAGALGVRSVLSDDDGDGEGGSDGGEEGDLVIACIPELEDACQALERDVAELRIEDPATTIADPDVDAWVTLDPWPEIAEIESSADLFGPSIPVAEADLALIARSTEVPPGCDPVEWVCLVAALGDRVAVDAGSALGLLVLAQAGSEFRPGFALNELRDDFELQAFLDSIDLTASDPVGDMLVLPDPDASGTSSADMESRVGRSATADDFVDSPSGAPATVAVVVAGREADRVTGEPSFTEALEQLGWELRSSAATTGLPNPGVLLALAQEVR
jgi:hypothetical protein